MSKNAPLLNNALRLYDAASLLEVDGEVARGFVVLLGGTPDDLKRNKSSQRSFAMDDSQVTLGFLAIMEGSVLDACFGIDRLSPKDARGRKHVREAKDLLADAADNNDDIRKLAVAAYQRAFAVVYAFQLKARRLHFFNRCFCFGKLQKQAQAGLKEAFVHVEEAVQAAL